MSWFKSHINNGILEGINSTVQAVKARAMWYRNNKYLWQIKAHLAGMRLCIYPHLTARNPFSQLQTIPRPIKSTDRGRSSRHSNLSALPGSRHPFNSKFEFEGFTFGHFRAGSQKLDRDAIPGVLGPFPKIMYLQSLLNIVGDPTIQGLVNAPDQIDDPILVGVQRSTLSFNSLPALKNGSSFGAIRRISRLPLRKEMSPSVQWESLINDSDAVAFLLLVMMRLPSVMS